MKRQTERAAQSNPSGLAMPEIRHRIRAGTGGPEEEQKRNQRRNRRDRKGTEDDLADRECSTGQPEWLDDACNQAQDPRRNRRGTEEEQERKSR